MTFSSVKKNIWAIVKIQRFENYPNIILKNINYAKNVDLLTKIYDKNTDWKK